MHLSRFSCLLAVAATVAFSLSSRGSENVQLKATIEQWMEVMRKVQAEEQRWQRESEILKDAKSSLASELAQLEEDIQAVKGRLKNADRSSQDKLEEKRSFDAARELLAGELDGLEELVMGVIPLVPEFFVNESTKLKKAMEQLLKNHGVEDKTKLGLNARLTPLVQILTEIERFNQKIWPIDEVLKVGGDEKQMKVAYFGLGVAYAVDANATVALLGRPGEAGWTFTALEGQEVAANVQALIGAADNSGESRMVTLPLNLAN